MMMASQFLQQQFLVHQVGWASTLKNKYSAELLEKSYGVFNFSVCYASEIQRWGCRDV